MFSSAKKKETKGKWIAFIAGAVIGGIVCITIDRWNHRDENDYEYEDDFDFDKERCDCNNCVDCDKDLCNSNEGIEKETEPIKDLDPDLKKYEDAFKIKN